MNVTVLEGQSLFDLAVQTSGSVEAVFDVAELNGLSVTDALIAGSVIETRYVVETRCIASVSVNQPIADYYAKNGLKPATDATDEAMNELRDEGIDYWAVEVDFIVQ